MLYILFLKIVVYVKYVSGPQISYWPMVGWSVVGTTGRLDGGRWSVAGGLKENPCNTDSVLKSTLSVDCQDFQHKTISGIFVQLS